MPTSVDTTRELADEPRLHLHQLVRIDLLAPGAGATRVPRHYVVTDLDADGGVEFMSAPVSDESYSVVLTPSVLRSLVLNGGLTPLYHGEMPEWGY